MIPHLTQSAPRAQGQPSNTPLDRALRCVRAARYRIEDEGRDFSTWDERLDLSALLAEVIDELLAERSAA